MCWLWIIVNSPKGKLPRVSMRVYQKHKSHVNGGRRDLQERSFRKESLLGRQIEKRPEDWCGRLFVKNSLIMLSISLSIIMRWDLALTYIKDWNLFRAQIWLSSEFCQLGNNKTWPQAEVWRCWCIQVCLLSLQGTYCPVYINSLGWWRVRDQETDVTDETANMQKTQICDQFMELIQSADIVQINILEKQTTKSWEKK